MESSSHSIGSNPLVLRKEQTIQALAGTGAVVIDAGRVLLVKRLHDPLAGYWSVPGGRVEPGEEIRAAATREVREETGLEVELGEVAAVVDHIERDGTGMVTCHYVIVDFLAKPIGGALRAAGDAGEAAWVGRKELDRYRLTAGLEEILLRVL